MRRFCVLTPPRKFWNPLVQNPESAPVKCHEKCLSWTFMNRRAKSTYHYPFWNHCPKWKVEIPHYDVPCTIQIYANYGTKFLHFSFYWHKANSRFTVRKCHHSYRALRNNTDLDFSLGHYSTKRFCYGAAFSNFRSVGTQQNYHTEVPPFVS